MPSSTSSHASQLAVRTFDSAEEAVHAVLDAVTRLLGTKSAFLTRTDLDARTMRVVSSLNLDERFVVPVGLEIPLEQTP